MKIYYMVAIFKNESGALMATKMAEGQAHGLRVELELLPPGTFRVGVMDKKIFDEILRTLEESPARALEHSRTEPESDR